MGVYYALRRRRSPLRCPLGSSRRMERTTGQPSHHHVCYLTKRLSWLALTESNRGHPKVLEVGPQQDWTVQTRRNGRPVPASHAHAYIHSTHTNSYWCGSVIQKKDRRKHEVRSVFVEERRDGWNTKASGEICKVL